MLSWGNYRKRICKTLRTLKHLKIINKVVVILQPRIAMMMIFIFIVAILMLLLPYQSHNSTANTGETTQGTEDEYYNPNIDMNTMKIAGFEAETVKVDVPIDTKFNPNLNHTIIDLSESEIDINRLKAMYRRTFWLNYVTATKYIPSKKWTFVLTGDLHLMWLRDSSAQMHPYLPLSVHNNEIKLILEGFIRMSAFYFHADPYGVAYYYYFHHPYNRNENELKSGNVGWMNYRLFELDSGAYFIWYLYKYWNIHKDNQILKEVQYAVAEYIRICQIEQDHETQSPYKRYTTRGNGVFPKVAKTGMVWQGYRPSDDKTTYGYNIPGNMFAALAMHFIVEMYNDDSSIINDAKKLKQDIITGIKNYGICDHEKMKIYCYEVDGFGNSLKMDDANHPSITSIPYFDEDGIIYDKDIYENSRKFIFSSANPMYFNGKYGSGLGATHTPNGCLWPLSLAMQGLTSNNNKEKIKILKILLNTDANKGVMHECFNINNPNHYQREWFGWPNAVFSEFAQQFLDEKFIYKVHHETPKRRIDEFCYTKIDKNINNVDIQQIFHCDDHKAISIMQSF